MCQNNIAEAIFMQLHLFGNNLQWYNFHFSLGSRDFMTVQPYFFSSVFLWRLHLKLAKQILENCRRSNTFQTQLKVRERSHVLVKFTRRTKEISLAFFAFLVNFPNFLPSNNYLFYILFIKEEKNISSGHNALLPLKEKMKRLKDTKREWEGKDWENL